MSPAFLSFALLPSLGGEELGIIFLAILLLFGGEKMPQLAKGLGKAVREFKKAAGDVEQEFKRALDEVPDSPPSKAAPPIPPPVPLAQRIDPPPPPGTSPAP